MLKDTNIKKCDVWGKYCICPKIPCHRKNKYLNWVNFAGISYPIASTGDIDLVDPMIKAEVVMTILQAEREEENRKILEVADKSIAEAKIVIAEAKKFLRGR